MKKDHYDIVFVTRIFLDKDNRYFSGGAEIHLLNVINAIKKNKKILVIQQNPWNNNKENLHLDGIDIVKIPCKSNLFFRLKVSLLLNCLKTKRIHFNDIGYDIFVLKRKNIVYSSTFHGTGWDFPIFNQPEYYVPSHFFYKLGISFMKIFMIFEQIFSLYKMDSILSVDTSLARFAHNFFYSKSKKINIIPNFVDLKRFAPKPKDINTLKKISILFPRNTSYARGVNLLVPIAKYLTKQRIKFSIKLAGSPINIKDGSRYEKILKWQIEKEGLGEYFDFIGRVKHEEMPKIYQDSDICIIPSMFSEGTSLSCLEAMASGVPVVVSNVGGLMDLVIDGFNGLLSKPTAEDFAQKILLLINDRKKYKSISNCALNMAKNVYNHDLWEIKIKNFLMLPSSEKDFSLSL